MAKLTINGVRIPTDLTLLTSSQINMAIGSNSLPKYPANHNKSRDELTLELMDAITTASRQVTKKTRKGANVRPTTSEASAKVKRVNIITDLCARTLSVDDAVDRLNADTLLQKFLSREEIEYAWDTGERPSRRPRTSTKDKHKAQDIANWIESEGRLLKLKDNESISEEGDIVADFNGKW